jgi:transketolase
MRKTFASTVATIIKENENSSLFLGDIGVFAFRELISNYPNRAFNIGILEQSMIGVAAGFSKKKLVPFIHTIAPFLVERALEQIKVDLGYQRLSANLVSVGASFDYAALGATHHCPGDIGILQTIEDIQLFVPGSPEELQFQIEKNWDNGKLNYFRLSESSNKTHVDMHSNSWAKISNGSRGTIVVIGPVLDEVLEYAIRSNFEVYYCNQVNRNAELISQLQSSEKLIIIEPYYSGPFFKVVKEIFEKKAIRYLEIGIPVEFSRLYGKTSDHYAYFGMTKEKIASRIEAFASEK